MRYITPYDDHCVAVIKQLPSFHSNEKIIIKEIFMGFGGIAKKKQQTWKYAAYGIARAQREFFLMLLQKYDRLNIEVNNINSFKIVIKISFTQRLHIWVHFHAKCHGYWKLMAICRSTRTYYVPVILSCLLDQPF